MHSVPHWGRCVDISLWVYHDITTSRQSPTMCRFRVFQETPRFWIDYHEQSPILVRFPRFGSVLMFWHWWFCLFIQTHIVKTFCFLGHGFTKNWLGKIYIRLNFNTWYIFYGSAPGQFFVNHVLEKQNFLTISACTERVSFIFWSFLWVFNVPKWMRYR